MMTRPERSTVRDWRVLKFGGSSVGTPERLARILDVVREERERACLAVVVSAPGDTTDWLIEAIDMAAGGANPDALIDRIAELSCATVRDALAARGQSWTALESVVTEVLRPLRRLLAGITEVGDYSLATRDRVLSFGEILSSQLVAGALNAVGVNAESVDARTWAVTDDHHGDATVLWGPTSARIAAAQDAWCGADGASDRPGASRGSTLVTVHTGFLGISRAGRTTTLGRNGSDYTAALLARGLHASDITIWTDVSGVMTGDPCLVDEAYPVPRLSYREALELAGLGLRMLHPRTMLPLLEAGIPMRIRNILRPEDPGTLVDAEGASNMDRPTCVTSLESMALIDLEGTQRSANAQLASRAVAALAAVDIPVWFATHAPYGNGIALVVRDVDVERAVDVVREDFEAEMARGDVAVPEVHAPVTLLTLVAEAMGQTVNVAGRFFGAIGAIGVNVRAASQGATSRAVSCVVDDRDTAVAVRAVHAAFNLAREQVNVLLLGKGTVGGNFLEQVASERPRLLAVHDLDLRVAGVVDRRASVFDGSGIEPRSVLARLEQSTSPADAIALLDQLARLPVPVLVDCTAADGMEEIYEAAFARGVHVVTANKKPLALPTARLAEVFTAARKASRAFRYETTVGASLPVIDTLKNLVRTGDRVNLIEGCLSGTLGYLANEISGGEKLSRAVRSALEKGYTEPHPRDDLSGTDAARKALILARELGLTLELADIDVEPFVPTSLLLHDDMNAFFRALEDYDATFSEKIQAMRAEGRFLRYLATIEPAHDGGCRVRVGPTSVRHDHPTMRLRGTEAFVAFRTERYSEYPLAVQGAGAGGPVTAAGVLADVLSMTQKLRGR